MKNTRFSKTDLETIKKFQIACEKVMVHLSENSGKIEKYLETLKLEMEIRNSNKSK